MSSEVFDRERLGGLFPSFSLPRLLAALTGAFLICYASVFASNNPSHALSSWLFPPSSHSPPPLPVSSSSPSASSSSALSLSGSSSFYSPLSAATAFLASSFHTSSSTSRTSATSSSSTFRTTSSTSQSFSSSSSTSRSSAASSSVSSSHTTSSFSSSFRSAAAASKHGSKIHAGEKNGQKAFASLAVEQGPENHAGKSHEHKGHDSSLFLSSFAAEHGPANHAGKSNQVQGSSLLLSSLAAEHGSGNDAGDRNERKHTPFQPQDALEELLVQPVLPPPLGVMHPPFPTRPLPCVFAYTSVWNDMLRTYGQLLNAESFSRSAWLYGAKLTADLMIQPTGHPDDIVKGKLLCWVGARGGSLRIRLSACDRFHRYNPEDASNGLVRAEVSVVRRAGQTSRALCYLVNSARQAQPIAQAASPTLLLSVSNNSTRDWSILGSEELLHLAATGSLDTQDLALAWFYLGRSLKDRPSYNLDRVRVDSRCAELVQALSSAVPSLSPELLAHVWAGASYVQTEETEKLLARLVPATVAAARQFQPSQLACLLKSLSKIKALADTTSLEVRINLLDALCQSLSGQCETADSESLVTCANALSKFRYYRPQPAHLSAVFGQLLARAGSLSAKNLTIAMNALARLGYLPSSEQTVLLYQAVSQQTATFNAQDLALALNCLSKLESQHPEAQSALPVLAGEVLHKAAAFKAQELAMVINAFAKLGHNPGPAVLSALAEACLRRSRELKAQEIGMVLNAFARLEHDPGPALLDELASQAFLKARDLNAQGISMTLNAFGKLDYHPEENVLSALSNECLFKALMPQGIAMSLNAFAKLDYYPDQAVLNSLSEGLQSKSAALNSQALATSLNALAKLAHHPGLKCMNALSASLMQKLETFKVLELCMALNAFSKLNYYPGDKVMTGLIDSLAKKMKKMSTQEIGLAGAAFARLNHNPGRPFLQQLAQHLLTKAKEPSASVHACKLLHALCLLDEMEVAKGLFELEVAKGLFELVPDLSVTAEDSAALGQLYVVHLTLTYLYPSFGSFVWPESLRKASFAQAANDHSHATSSALHLDVSRVIEVKLGLEHLNEDTQTGLSVDISIPEQKIAIEVDGPYHFNYDPDGHASYLGTTLHKRKLLRAMGWRVVSVPYYEWEQHDSSEAKARYLHGKITAAT
eukprot:g4125.t1